MGDWSQQKKSKMENFDQLLNDIEAASSKEKILWREIYENAICDRAKSEEMYDAIRDSMLSGDPGQHTMLGSAVSQYLTRLEKSNKQLIELANLISDRLSEGSSDTLNSDDIFAAIQAEQKE